MVLDDVHRLRTDVDELQFKNKQILESIRDGIQELDVEYISTDSRSNPPLQSDPLWSSESPLYTDDTYIWSRTKITPPSGEPKYTTPVCITGYNGVDGVDGGVDETGIPYENLFIHIRFSATNNPLSLEQIHILPQGRGWIGKYVSTNSTPPLDPSVYSWSRWNGGVAIGPTGNFLHLRFAYSDTGEEMNTFGGGYRGYYIDTNTEDSLDPSSYTWSNVKGRTILQITEEYCLTNSYTIPPTTGWRTTVPPNEIGKFYWTRSSITFSDGTVETTDATCVSGMDGERIQYIYYLSTTGETPSTPTDVGNGWTDDPRGVNGENMFEFVSVRTKVYNDGRYTWTNFSTPVLWAKFGETGQQGQAGVGLSQEESDMLNNLMSDNMNASTLLGVTGEMYVQNKIEATDINLTTGSGNVTLHCWGRLVVITIREFGWTVSTNSYVKIGEFDSKYAPQFNEVVRAEWSELRFMATTDGELKVNAPSSIATGTSTWGNYAKIIYLLGNDLTNTSITQVTGLTSGNAIPLTHTVDYQLKDEYGNILESKPVSVNINGVKYTKTTDNNGKVAFPINIGVSEDNNIVTSYMGVYASFNGSVNYHSSGKNGNVYYRKIEANEMVCYCNWISSENHMRITLKTRINGVEKPFGYKTIWIREVNNITQEGKFHTVKTNGSGMVGLSVNDNSTYDIDVPPDEKVHNGKQSISGFTVINGVIR